MCLAADADGALSLSDVANHYRQDGLGMETAFRTQTWWVRIFMSVLGIATTNAYLMFVAICKRNGVPTDKPFKAFINELATALCQQGKPAAQAAHKKRRHSGGASEEHVDKAAREVQELGITCKFARVGSSTPVQVRCVAGASALAYPVCCGGPGEQASQTQAPVRGGGRRRRA
jgi:hypothetical protein